MVLCFNGYDLMVYAKISKEIIKNNNKSCLKIYFTGVNIYLFSMRDNQ